MSLHEKDNTTHMEIVVTHVAELELALAQLQGKFEVQSVSLYTVFIEHCWKIIIVREKMFVLFDYY